MREPTEQRQLLIDHLDPLLTESLSGAMKGDITTTPPPPPRPPDVRNCGDKICHTPQIHVSKISLQTHFKDLELRITRALCCVQVS